MYSTLALDSQLPTNSFAEDSLAFSIEEFVARSENFRVATPGSIPTPYPFTVMPCSQSASQAYQNLKQKCHQILQSNQVDVDSMQCYSIFRKGHSSERVDIILIETHDEDTTKWSNATSEISNLFAGAGINTAQLKVEIRNDSKAKFHVSYPLPNDPQLLGAIRVVRAKILEIVDKNLNDICTSVAYHMRGKKNDNSPRKPTILVFCKPESRTFFAAIEKSMLAVLRSPQHPQATLHLEILPGFIELISPPSPKPAKPVIYRKLLAPENLSSIGVRKNQEDAGTLGGFVNLQLGTGPPMKCVLTCYHVIRNGDPVNRALNDQKGIGLDGKQPPSQIDVMYPSLFDIAASRDVLSAKIQESNVTNPSDLQTLQQLDLQATNAIGQVKYASGHRRTAKNQRLDWAVIESPSTFFRNRPPPSSRFEGGGLEWGRIEYETSPTDLITTFASIPQGVDSQWVAKAGRSSVTSGFVNPEPRDVKWYDQPMSQEMDIIGNAEDFAMGGDSGSWVVNQQKELVGIVIGSDSKSGQWGSGIVTPIKLIMEDIELKVKGKISLP